MSGRIRSRAIDVHQSILDDATIAGLSDRAFRDWFRLWMFREPPSTAHELAGSGLCRSRHGGFAPLAPLDPRGRPLVKPTTAWSRQHCEAVQRRDGGLCRYCRGVATTIDHVVPRSRGGSDDADNLVACCRRCNSKKWARTPAEAGMVLLPAPEASNA